MPPREKKEKLVPAKNVSADILGPRLVFILSVVALLLFGLVMIYSASNVEALNNEQSPLYYVLKQFFYCVFGIVIAIAVWRWIPYNFWNDKRILWGILGGIMLLMLATLIGGQDILGAKRWITIGPVSFQPSEFLKIILILLVAKYYADFKINEISKEKCLLVIVCLTIGLTLFILGGQSDLGTTIICIVGILAFLLIAGFPLHWFVALVLAVVLFGAVVILATSWRSDRMIFMDPYNDGAGGYGAGYQLIRSFYAFAQGGLFGVGLGNSYEKYQYLPEAETDFIFAIIGEELGMFGCLIVIALFVAFIVSGIMIVARSNSLFWGSISGAFVIMIGFQAFLNILCVVGLLPTTGKPLPFISAGGSSLLATLTMVGFILKSSEVEAKPDKYERRRANFHVSGNLSSRQWTKQEDDQDESKRRRNTSTSRQRTSRTSATKGVKKTPNVKDPKFLDSREKRQPATKTAPKKSGSYAYRRSSSGVNFKPAKSAVKRDSSRSR